MSEAAGAENISRERAAVATYQPRRESENHYRPLSALRITAERIREGFMPPAFRNNWLRRYIADRTVVAKRRHGASRARPTLSRLAREESVNPIKDE